MKALVTGGAGFIGGALVRSLLASGKYEEVVVFDNLVTNPSGVHQACHFVHGDVRIADDVDRLKYSGPFDVVFHMAASFANELSVSYPRIDLGTNVTGTVNVLTQLKNDMGLFVYAGSSSSYGNSKGSAFKETDEISPGTPYAVSKHVGEEYTRLLARRWVTFRFFNVFGEGDIPGKFRNVIPNMVARAMLASGFQTFGEEVGAGRDFTYIDDIVRVLLLSADLPANEVYNLCSGHLTTVALISAMVDKSLRDIGVSQFSIQRLPIREWDTVVRRWGDNTKIVEACNRLHESVKFRTFDSTVGQKTIEWVRDYVDQSGGWIELV